MADETTFQRIARESESRPTECHCSLCQQMCHTPCLGTPEDIERLVDAGYADRLVPTEWGVGLIVGLISRPVYMLQADTVNGWCTFYHNGLCELHDKGLKPTEGRLAHHTDPIIHGNQPTSLNVAWLIAKEWMKDENFNTVLRICDKIKQQLK